MKRIIHNSGLSYAMDFIPRPAGAMLEIIHLGKHATEIIERPTLIDLARQAHDERDFGVYLQIFQALENPDIAAMGLDEAERLAA